MFFQILIIGCVFVATLLIKEWGILQLAETVCEIVENLTGRKPELNISESEEIFSSALNSTSFSNQFGWNPKISIYQFINELANKIISGM